MTHIGLFEGIGGFSLAARWMGWETKAWCEWDTFCQRVLKYHFPEADQHGDITTTDFTRYAGQIDILTGGFPCQPYSAAGKRLGKEDDRHLWPEMLRAIREIQPRWVVGENVRGLTNWNGGLVFDEVQADLENEGYEVTPYLLPACAVNAPHRRDRIWFVAHAVGKGAGCKCGQACNKKRRTCKDWGESVRQEYGQACASWNNTAGLDATNASKGQCKGRGEFDGNWQDAEEIETGVFDRVARLSEYRPIAHPGEARHERSKQPGAFEQGSGRKQPPGPTTKLHQVSDWQHFPTKPPVCGGDDGISRTLDGITFPKWREKSIGAYGNAIVPQVALQIFKAIQQYER